ncbi:hypothetical protein CsSME_00014643 [Camellia sinensis var. sinensis]
MEINPKTQDYKAITELVPIRLLVVKLPDFFLADQLTSKVNYKHRQNTCMDSGVYNTFYFIVATIPYVSRLLQKDGMQGLNGVKYFITIVALCMRIDYSLNKGVSWNILAWIASVIVVVFGTYWDLVLDWGLLQRKSKNRWLILNVLLRFVWLQTVFHQVPFLHKQIVAVIVAVLEIIHRGIWNLFRLENEHLNNVDKYRAFKSVPLPFNYNEDDDKDE